MIRLKRVGRKHDPSFRVVVTEKHLGTKSNKYKEVLGHYDARSDKKTLHGERIKYWLSVGAQPSVTVHNLLVSAGIMEGKKKNPLSKKRPIKGEETAEKGQPGGATGATKEENKPEPEPAEIKKEDVEKTKEE